MYDVYRFLIAALFTWRVTHFLQSEDGPWDVGLRLRRAAGDSSIGHLLDCFYCLSIWIGLLAAWLARSDAGTFLLLWPALSGAAILFERSTAGEQYRPSAPKAEFKEDDREQ
jgi:hypothetical protein